MDIAKAIELGATKIIVIDNENRGLINTIIFSILIRFRGKMFSNNYYRNIKNAETILSTSNVDIVYLLPKSKIKVAPMDNNSKKLQNTFKQGFNETVNNKDLITFIN
jgi:hypothetical protein